LNSQTTNLLRFLILQKLRHTVDKVLKENKDVGRNIVRKQMIVINYIKTWKKIMSNPTDFYRTMPTIRGYSDPLTFATVSLIIFGLLNAFIGLMIFNIGYTDIIAQAVSSFGQLILFFIIFVLANMNEFIGAPYYDYEDYTILSVIIVSIFGIIFLRIGAKILHVIYKILGGAGNYEGTLRFTSYATAVNILTFIPILGWIFTIYLLYLYIVGGMIVHNVSIWKATVATILETIAIVILALAAGYAILLITLVLLLEF
jgi:hypothetical protein